MSQNKNGAPAQSELKLSRRLSFKALRVPIAEDDPIRYAQQHVDAQLDADQARTLKRIKDALNDSHERLKNGRHVNSSADAVRWLLEQIAKTAIRK